MTHADTKKIVYIDMDDTLCDFRGAYTRYRLERPSLKFPQSSQNFFLDLEPISGAIDTFIWLNKQPEFDVYILTAPSIKNPLCYTEKRLWIERYLGFAAVKQLIITPHKNLNKGHYLIDDNVNGKGQENFEGEVINYGSTLHPNWTAVHQYFKTKIDNGELPKLLENTHSGILCFRAFDLRDRFSEPVATFREALELLQSGRAYLPEKSSNIVCYLKNGQSIPIPELFYLEDRLQVASAANHKTTEVIEPPENDRVCAALSTWLNSAIKKMPDVNDERQKIIKSLVLQDDEALVSYFKDKVTDKTKPSRWVVVSRDFGLTAISGYAYFDLMNHVWVPDIAEASCIKDRIVAEAVTTSFSNHLRVDIMPHFISQKELAKITIKIKSNPKVITYHPESDIYLYEERNSFSKSSSQAILTLRKPEQYLIDRNVVGVEQLMVSIPDAAMDEVSIAWCKHRKLQGALGGPIGNEWGAPDCDYD